MTLHRRTCLQSIAGGLLAGGLPGWAAADNPQRRESRLRITRLTITPIALPDPPLLAASGCHGPYFLRNIVQIETDGGITGIGETKGGQHRTEALERARRIVVGQDAFAYRRFAPDVQRLGSAIYAGIELACLDALGKATNRKLCELLGGPVRSEVEFAAYLFYRYAADDRRVLQDRRTVDSRGGGDQALDQWGEVRTADAMVRMAEGFRRRWGFRVYKLKAGVLDPNIELATMQGMNQHFRGRNPLRIDPNGRWRRNTAIRIGRAMRDLNLEYYEDPVRGQEEMAHIKQATGLRMSTNSCITRFNHIPDAVRNQPVDVILGDHHGWGGIPAFQELGRICGTFGWGLSHHSNNHAGITMAAMIHVGAVVPELTYASDTHYVWLAEGKDIIQGNNLLIRNGRMQIPNRPGVGVELDQDKLRRANEVYRRCGMRERDDATTMRMFVPDWERTLY